MSKINFFRRLEEQERQREAEEKRIRGIQRLKDEAKEYSLRKAILEDSVNFFESKNKLILLRIEIINFKKFRSALKSSRIQNSTTNRIRMDKIFEMRKNSKHSNSLRCANISV